MTAPAVQYLDFTTDPVFATLHDRKPDGVESVEVTPAMLRALPGLVEALDGLVRYAEAVRMSAGMGKSQLARLDAAKAALRLARGGES